MALFFRMIFITSLLAVQLEAGGLLPEIHVTNGVSRKDSPPVNINFAGDAPLGTIRLKPGQSFQLNINFNQVYYATATFGSKTAAFHVYEPARDLDRSAIYWKADNKGFSISYDNLKWKKVTPWKSE